MPDLPPEIELVLRAGEACAAGPAADLAGLRAALAAIDGAVLSPRLTAAQRAAEALLEAPRQARAAAAAALSAELQAFDRDPVADPVLVHAWQRRKDLA